MDTKARERILDEARTWVGTPFHHKARIKGVGVDCGGLIYECYKDAIPGLQPFPSYYAEDWAVHKENEIYLDFIGPYVQEVQSPKPADLIIYQFGRNFSHGTIYIGNGHVIHAWGRTQFGKVRVDNVAFFRPRKFKVFEVA